METWVGFYIHRDARFEMTFEFVEINPNTGQFRASGADNCGNFTYNGNIIGANFTAVKTYPTWVIYYSGRYYAEKNEISGFWGYNPQEMVSTFGIVKIPRNKVQQFRNNLEIEEDPLINI